MLNQHVFPAYPGLAPGQAIGGVTPAFGQETDADFGEEAEVPESLSSQIETFREKLIEAVAETDDSLIEKYLEGEELSQEEITNGLRQGTVSGKIVPILVGSALQNVGIKLLLNSINSYLPSPKERGVAIASDSTENVIEASQEAPLGALVFKPKG